MEVKKLVRYSTACPQCKQYWNVVVDKDAFDKYVGGMLTQDAFPELPASEREIFITGVCPTCWDKLMGPEEEIIPGDIFD